MPRHQALRQALNWRQLARFIDEQLPLVTDAGLREHAARIRDDAEALCRANLRKVTTNQTN